MTYSLTGKLREPTHQNRRPENVPGRDGRQAGKPIGDGINQMVSGCNATALFGDVIPDIIEVGCRLWRYAVRHQRGEDCSAARRTWPRCFTSSARPSMDSCVMLRPSLRAREALASSRVAKNSAFCARALPTATMLPLPHPRHGETARLDGLANERLLVGRQTHFHAPKLRGREASVKPSAFPPPSPQGNAGAD